MYRSMASLSGPCRLLDSPDGGGQLFAYLAAAKLIGPIKREPYQ
jgi:hypothetical protein